MIKITVVDWSDGAYAENNGEASVIAEIELPEFKGFCFDGGRLEFVGHADTIYVPSEQFSVRVG